MQRGRPPLFSWEEIAKLGENYWQIRRENPELSDRKIHTQLGEKYGVHRNTVYKSLKKNVDYVKEIELKLKEYNKSVEEEKSFLESFENLVSKYSEHDEKKGYEMIELGKIKSSLVILNEVNEERHKYSNLIGTCLNCLVNPELKEPEKIGRKRTDVEERANFLLYNQNLTPSETCKKLLEEGVSRTTAYNHVFVFQDDEKKEKYLKKARERTKKNYPEAKKIRKEKSAIRKRSMVVTDGMRYDPKRGLIEINPSLLENFKKDATAYSNLLSREEMLFGNMKGEHAKNIIEYTGEIEKIFEENVTAREFKTEHVKVTKDEIKRSKTDEMRESRFGYIKEGLGRVEMHQKVAKEFGVSLETVYRTLGPYKSDLDSVKKRTENKNKAKPNEYSFLDDEARKLLDKRAPKEVIKKLAEKYEINQDTVRYHVKNCVTKREQPEPGKRGPPRKINDDIFESMKHEKWQLTEALAEQIGKNLTSEEAYEIMATKKISPGAIKNHFYKYGSKERYENYIKTQKKSVEKYNKKKKLEKTDETCREDREPLVITEGLAFDFRENKMKVNPLLMKHYYQTPEDFYSLLDSGIDGPDKKTSRKIISYIAEIKPAILKSRKDFYKMLEEGPIGKHVELVQDKITLAEKLVEKPYETPEVVEAKPDERKKKIGLRKTERMEKAKEAHVLGMNQKEAVEYVGVTNSSTICKYWKEMGLKPQYKRGRSVSEDKIEKIREAHDLGMNLKEAAEYTSLHRTTVKYHWKNMGLKTNYKEGGARIPNEKLEKIRKGYDLGMEMKEISEYAGVNKTTAKKYLDKWGLELQYKSGPKGLSEDLIEKIREAHTLKMSQSEACEHAGVSYHTLKKYWKEMGLKHHSSKKRISDEKVEKIKEAHRLEMKIYEAAQYAGVTNFTLKKYWKEMGLEPHQIVGGRSISNEKLEKIRKGYDLGMNLEEISKYADVNRNTAKNYLVKWDLKPHYKEREKPRFRLSKKFEQDWGMSLENLGDEEREILKRTKDYVYSQETPSIPQDSCGCEIITLNELSRAISKAFDIDMEEAKPTAEIVLDFIGFDNRFLDNTLDTKERQLFYQLEEEGIFVMEGEENILYDGRYWRSNYWRMRKDAIKKYANYETESVKIETKGTDKIHIGPETEISPEAAYETEEVQEEWNKYIKPKEVNQD